MDFRTPEWPGAGHLQSPTGRPLLYGIADPDGSAAALEYLGFCEWLLWLPIGFVSNPMDLYGGDDADEDLLFAQYASISSQFAQQRQLRIRAQEAALKDIAKSKLRRLMAYTKPSIASISKSAIWSSFTKRLIRKAIRAGEDRPQSWKLMSRG